jgi:hypothetical protein
MPVFAWWSDLAEFWSDLFDNPLHSAFALIVCATAVLISIVLVLRFRPAEVRKLAWRVLLASAAFYVVIFGPWSSGRLRSDSWTEFLFVFVLGVLLLLIFFFANYWCIPVLLAWPYKNERRHSWHVWGAWLCITVWTAWSLLNLGEGYITGGHFLWIPVLAAFIGGFTGETVFCLKTDRRYGRVAALGSVLCSMLVVAGFLAYKVFHPPQPTPVIVEDRTNATVRARNEFSGMKRIAGCKDPSDTLLWIEVAIRGPRQEHPRTVADFEAQYFHECGFFIVDTRESVEGARKNFGGVDMLCIKDLFNANACNWIPASAIEPDAPVSEQR